MDEGDSADEARALFTGAADLRLDTVDTPYDLRVGRRRFLPRWTARLVPSALGWFQVSAGAKAGVEPVEPEPGPEPARDSAS